MDIHSFSMFQLASLCFTLFHFVSLCPFTSLWPYHQGWADDNRVAPRWCLQEGLRVSASLNRVSNYLYPSLGSRHFATLDDTDASAFDV